MFVQFTRDYVTGSGKLFQGGEIFDLEKAWAQQLINDGAATLWTSADPKYAMLNTDPVTGKATSITGPDGTPAIKFTSTTVQPWKAAFWGDGRHNGFNGTTVDVAGTGVNALTYRSPLWICGVMGDVEYSRSYAVSGDTASAWNSTARTNGKTFSSLNTSDSDVVFIQYGVNDALAGTAASTLAGYLQNLITEIFKSGKLVVFESIYPVNTPCSNYAAAQVIIDATNARMQTWLASYPTQAVYVDIATTFKAGGTYASYTYMAAADGVHPTRVGAQTAGELVAAAARVLMPKRIAAFYGPASPAPNICNLSGAVPITTQFNSQNHGTATVVQSSGQDANGIYYEWTVTPLTFGTTYTETVLQLSANFQTANPPFYALTGNEILQGGARIVVDDGAGGSPNTYSFALRQRFFTGAIYNEVGTIGAPNALDVTHTKKVDQQWLTPKLFNATASAVASPAANAGYALQLIIDSSTIGVPFRVRLYNPQLRRVGYTSVPVSSTVGASPATITNTTNGPQQYIISGGTVSSITLNTISTGLTSGVFLLDPGDALVITHTGAPTQVLKQMLTQPTLRGLI